MDGINGIFCRTYCRKVYLMNWSTLWERVLRRMGGMHLVFFVDEFGANAKAGKLIPQSTTLRISI